MKIKEMLLPILVLAVSALLLFGGSAALKGVTEEKRAEDRQYVMEHLLPGSTEFTEEAYEGEDANIVKVFKGTNGYVVETKVAGYADPMDIMVGVSNEGVVTGLVVLDMAETYGLGQQALTDVMFLSQFLRTKGDVVVGEVADGEAGATGESQEESMDGTSGATGESEPLEGGVSVDALTGATVTSKAIAKAVNSAAAFVTGADVSSGATEW